jgi:NO-binding membrane sensor protein with MHYT domain
VGGAIAGTGIVVMHYTGMAAMTTSGTPVYQPLPFALSVLIAVAAASAALYLFSQVRGEAAARLGRPTLYGIKAAAALVMGVAIVGMHYTGMAAVKFRVEDGAVATSVLGGGTDTGMLGMIVLIITFVVLGLAVASIAMDSNDSELAQDF